MTDLNRDILKILHQIKYKNRISQMKIFFSSSDNQALIKECQYCYVHQFSAYKIKLLMQKKLLISLSCTYLLKFE